LDAQHRLLNCSEVASGDFGRVNVSVRNVIRRVIEDNASYVVLAHNHPNALANPSSADISCTLDLVKALHAVGVSMETHFIFGKNGTYFNMAESPDHSHIFKTNWRGLQ
jgi:DNA repair protein RadC